MHLIPMITEVQYNLVEDTKDINTRKAVFRVRINGNIGWLDMLQGAEFFLYLKNNMPDFCSNLKKYGVRYLEAIVSDEILILLKQIVDNQLRIFCVNPTTLHDLHMNHITFTVH